VGLRRGDQFQFFFFVCGRSGGGGIYRDREKNGDLFNS
jgi:hypothetical protein